MLNIIGWIILGLVAGALAKFIMPGKDPGGIIITIIIGIVGAFVGGWISGFFGFGKATGLNFPSLLIAVVGAVILLAIYRLIKKKA